MVAGETCHQLVLGWEKSREDSRQKATGPSQDHQGLLNLLVPSALKDDLSKDDQRCNVDGRSQPVMVDGKRLPCGSDAEPKDGRASSPCSPPHSIHMDIPMTLQRLPHEAEHL